MFVMIPEIVDQDHRLNAKAQRLCGYIIGLSSAKFGCIASNSYFAEKLNVSIPTVNRYLQELKEYDYIEVEFIEKKHSHQGLQRIITVTPKILINMKQAKKNENNRKSFEPDWLSNAMNEL